MKVPFIFILCLIGLIPLSAFSDSQVHPLISKRYSGDSFDMGQVVTPKQILALAEAARHSPSSYNEQPWVFIICDRLQHPEAFDMAFSALNPSNQSWCQDVQVLAIICANEKLRRNNKTNFWAQYDTGAAAISMALQASFMGLMTHQIGGFDDDRVRELFQVPENLNPLSIMAIGYETEEAKKNPPERTRRKLSDNFFLGSFQNALQE